MSLDALTEFSDSPQASQNAGFEDMSGIVPKKGYRLRDLFPSPSDSDPRLCAIACVRWAS